MSAQVLKLWNTALDTSRESLLTALEAREDDLEARESSLAARETAVKERSEVIETRLQSQSDAATLAREQLLIVNQRADGLEALLKSREVERAQVIERTEFLEKDLAALRAKQDAATAAHESQRARLEERYESSEARWLLEVDRARQALKTASIAHEKHAKESRSEVQRTEAELAALKREMQQLKSTARADAKNRSVLEARLRGLSGTKPAGPKKEGDAMHTRLTLQTSTSGRRLRSAIARLLGLYGRAEKRRRVVTGNELSAPERSSNEIGHVGFCALL